jgi:hypothetical protein
MYLKLKKDSFKFEWASQATQIYILFTSLKSVTKLLMEKEIECVGETDRSGLIPPTLLYEQIFCQ